MQTNNPGDLLQMRNDQSYQLMMIYKKLYAKNIMAKAHPNPIIPKIVH